MPPSRLKRKLMLAHISIGLMEKHAILISPSGSSFVIIDEAARPLLKQLTRFATQPYKAFVDELMQFRNNHVENVYVYEGYPTLEDQESNFHFLRWKENVQNDSSESTKGRVNVYESTVSVEGCSMKQPFGDLFCRTCVMTPVSASKSVLVTRVGLVDGLPLDVAPSTVKKATSQPLKNKSTSSPSTRTPPSSTPPLINQAYQATPYTPMDHTPDWVSISNPLLCGQVACLLTHPSHAEYPFGDVRG